MVAPAAWREAWTEARPTERAILALLLLNGLSVAQLESLRPEDCVGDWVRLEDLALPLLPLCAEAVQALGGIWWQAEEVRLTLTAYGLTENSAQRLLAGALWYTSEARQLTQDLGTGEAAPILPLANMFPISVAPRLADYADDPIALQARHALQAAADWLIATVIAPPPPAPLVQRIIGLLKQGRTVFLLVSTGVSGLNLLHNLLMGRLLAPAAYGQLTLVITLQLLISLLPNALQTVTARYGAGYAAQEDIARLRGLLAWARRRMALIGVLLSVGLLLAAPVIANAFQLRDAWLVVPIALATLPFVVMGADRGVLQAINGYFWLAAAYLAEAGARLGLGVLLVLLLAGSAAQVDGAIWALAQGMFLTWLIGYLALRLPRGQSAQADARADWQRLSLLTLAALIGQAIITNSDFLLVKSLFSAEEAGLYAAVSVLGRIAYFGVLPLTTVMIPAIARQQALGQATRGSFIVLMGGGAALCTGLLIVATLFPHTIVTLLYGSAYAEGGALLPWYTLAASLYVLTNLLVLYRIALGRGGETLLPVVAGVAQIIGILLFHSSLIAVIGVQIVLMGALLAGVAWRVSRG